MKMTKEQAIRTSQDPLVRRDRVLAQERRAQRGGFRDAETVRANRAGKRRKK